MAGFHTPIKPQWIVTWGLLGVLLAGLGWTFGRFRASVDNAPGPTPTARIVSGGSMAPTLVGPSRIARCDTCNLTTAVDRVAGELSREQLLCSHCGGFLQLLDSEATQRDGADVVDVVPLETDQPLRHGDLVAAERADSELFMKRVVGVSGDVIDLDSTGRRLLIGGQRIEDLLFPVTGITPLPRFLVDRDPSRVVSRWLSEPNHWMRDRQGRWKPNRENHDAWLVYAHQSVYDRNQPSRILDDYQYNVAVARKLQPVDRLMLSGQCACPSGAKITVAFWTPEQTRLAEFDMIESGEFQVSWFDAAANQQENKEAAAPAAIPVTATGPLAVRVRGQSIVLSQLVIERLIEYRLRPGDDRGRYPIKIGPGQLFLLGDNVPVSIDSRDFGLISRDNVKGVVIPKDRKPTTFNSSFGRTP